MPAEQLYPGVYVSEGGGPRAIAGVATSIALFIGWAPRGPIDSAVRIFSFADFQRVLGGLDARSRLGYAVMHFFANGGSEAFVIRLVDADASAAKCTVGSLTVAARSPGDWANALGIVTTTDADDPTRFRLDITDGDNVVESFANLSLTVTDERYAPAVINAHSALVTVEATAPAAIPADGTVLLSAVAEGHVGAPLAPDAPGDAGVRFRAGLLAFFAADGLADRIDLFNLICVPGLVDAATIEALQQCARDRRALLLVDCDETATEQTAIASLAGKAGANADHAAFYFPWVEAPDPLQGGGLRAFPPCGFVAGIIARTDRDQGVWKAPAGIGVSLAGAAGLAVNLTDTENGPLNGAGINCLRTFPIYGTVLWGARTMAGADSRASEWKYVPVRRTALYIEESLFRGTHWVVFEPNGEPLWAQIRLNVGAFMQSLFRQGAFKGSTPRDAYFVKCDATTTTQDDINNGIVNIVIGFAPLKPAEFVIISIRQMAGAPVSG